MNQVNISAEQVAAASRAGLKLLTDDERVNVPPSMALSGDLTILTGFLQGLASGELVLGPRPQEPEVLTPGGGELPPPDGNGEETPAGE